MEDKIIVEGKEYKLITLRGRGKYIAKDGSAINPYKKKQKCTIHYNQVPILHIEKLGNIFDIIS